MSLDHYNDRLNSAKRFLARARRASRPQEQYVLYMAAFGAAAIAGDVARQSDLGEMRFATAHQLTQEASRELARVCGIDLKTNPSEAAGAALGGGAGALLLGPIGAIAGGYTGAKLAEKRKKSKKNKPTKNPNRGRYALRKIMRGT